ncbi:hypothetical protein KXW02_007505, partial [Aspergillus fumigatus]
RADPGRKMGERESHQHQGDACGAIGRVALAGELALPGGAADGRGGRRRLVGLRPSGGLRERGAAFDAVHLGLNVRIGELQGFDVEMTEVGEHLYGKLFDLPRVKIGEALSVLQIAAG